MTADTWFRIEYDDADKYKILWKIGSHVFVSDIRYSVAELQKFVEEMCNMGN